MKLVSKGDFKCKTSVLYVDEIGQLKGHFNSMPDGLLEREKIKDTFGKFMTFEIAEKLLNEKKVNIRSNEIRNRIEIVERIKEAIRLRLTCSFRV